MIIAIEWCHKGAKTVDERGKMVFKAKVSGEMHAYVHYAKEWKGLSAKQIIQQSQISRASLYCILKEAKSGENNQERLKKKSYRTPLKIVCTSRARSREINCIENIFNIIKTILHDDARRKNITFETFDQFCAWVSDTSKSLDKNLTDRTIVSINKRIDLIIANKGQHTKYWLNMINYHFPSTILTLLSPIFITDKSFVWHCHVVK